MYVCMCIYVYTHIVNIQYILYNIYIYIYTIYCEIEPAPRRRVCNPEGALSLRRLGCGLTGPKTTKHGPPAMLYNVNCVVYVV